MPSPQTTDLVSLLDLDPELGVMLDGAGYERAARDVVVLTRRLPVGLWDVSRLSGATARDLGLLVLDGVLCRELVVEGESSRELLGPGDLARPWQSEHDTALLPVRTIWWVLSPIRLAILDRRVGDELARYPEIIAALMERVSERSLRLATTQAIAQLTGVDRRLKALFWHLAERWGRVSPDGVVVPLALSHRLLGQIVGARRPTVSSALAGLADRRELTRRSDGSWLLRGDPPDATTLARRFGEGRRDVPAATDRRRAGRISRASTRDMRQ
jgi:CRP/FNR family cyclic AMP-dependent transcriptional regulator